MNKLPLIQEIENKADKSYVDELFNEYKIYTDLSQLGCTVETDVAQIPPLMRDKSMLIATIYTASGVPHYPTKGGLLTIKRHASSRVEMYLSTYDGYAYFAFWDNGTYRPWREIATADKFFGVKNPNYTGNIDELYRSGQYILQNPFSGTLPSNQSTGTAQWSVLNVYGGGDSGSMLYQDLTTTNHTAYGEYANRYYRRIRFGNTWGDWKELATTSKINNLSLLNGWVVYGSGHTKVSAVKNGDMVSIVGIIKGGTITDGTTIIQMPDGWKPSYAQTSQLLTARGSSAPLARVNITSDGAIKIYALTGVATTDYVSLEIIYIL